MMKLRQALASALATTIAVTCFSIPTVAVRVFDTPQALIEDVLETSCADVTSGTLSDAINTVKSGITISGDQVLYNETPLGYWYDDASATLYADAGKSVALIEESGEGYAVDPSILTLLLTDVNTNITETYVPTTTDWSKIVGNYDVKLGDLTVPAQNWIPLEIKQDDELLPDDIEDHAYFCDFSSETGLKMSDIVCAHVRGEAANTLFLFFYIIDKDGKLYVQDAVGDIYSVNERNGGRIFGLYRSALIGDWAPYNSPGGHTLCRDTMENYIALSMGINADNDITGYIYATNRTADSYSCNAFSVYTKLYDITYRDITDAALTFTGTLADIKSQGVFYARGMADEQTDFSDGACMNLFSKFFDTQTSSKTVIGSSLLTKRIAKLSTLNHGDTVTITTTNWLVNGVESIDSYIVTQELTLAGTPANILGTVDIEERSFKVVVPAYLPMLADPEGNVTTATNAAIENKSNAAVKITDLTISAVAQSGWTLVDNNPSKTRGANEFTFGTSLEIGDTIAQGQNLAFTYSAKMSPAEQGVSIIDIVTLMITLDWEE